jgi:hypothetical protein
MTRPVQLVHRFSAQAGFVGRGAAGRRIAAAGP